MIDPDPKIVWLRRSPRRPLSPTTGTTPPVASIEAIDHVGRLATFVGANDPMDVAADLLPAEIDRLRTQIEAVVDWLRRLRVAMPYPPMPDDVIPERLVE